MTTRVPRNSDTRSASSFQLEDERQIHAWEKLAQRNAMWASCTSGKRHVDWTLARFLQSGDREVAWALAHARSINVLPDKVDTALDFGCGPGRLIGQLATVADTVLGVDASPTMLDIARRNFPSGQFRFTTSLSDIVSDSIGLAYSTFVLQHVTEDGRRALIGQIARCLRSDGLFIFQLPRKPRLTFGGLAWTLLPLPVMMWIQRSILRFPEAMPMRWADESRVRTELDAAGLQLVDAVEGLIYSPNWCDRWYFAKKSS